MATNAGPNASTGVGGDAEAVEPEPRCPVCDVAYDSVSVHDTGLMVNLLDNERYRRVCFDPVEENGPRIRFYHHTHEQTALSE